VQFTSAAFTGVLAASGVRISMDGKGRYVDNIFIERLWRSLKYGDIYLKAYASVPEARRGIGGLRPALEIAVNRAAWRQVAGNMAPCATGAEHRQDTVDDLLLAPASPRRRDHSLDLRPLGIRQVAGVAQLVSVVPRPVLGVPHWAPRESMPDSASRKFNGFKPPMLTDSNNSRSSRTDT
jgi:putative transposase